MRKVGAMREHLGNEGLVLYSVLSHLFEILMIQKELFSFVVERCHPTRSHVNYTKCLE